MTIQIWGRWTNYIRPPRRAMVEMGVAHEQPLRMWGSIRLLSWLSDTDSCPFLFSGYSSGSTKSQYPRHLLPNWFWLFSYDKKYNEWFWFLSSRDVPLGGHIELNQHQFIYYLLFEWRLSMKRIYSISPF